MMNKYTKYKDIPFSAEQWQILKKAIDQDLEIDDIADEHFNPEQLEVLIKGKKHHVDIEVIRDPAIPAAQMNSILEHIMAEMGVYEDHYEAVRRKWLKNMTWLITLVLIVICVSVLYLFNKDLIAAYTDELNLEVEKEVTLEAGSDFNAADYIVAFTNTATLTLPQADTLTPGTHYIEYSVSNGVKSKTAKLKLNVVDTTSPKIQLSQNYLSLKASEGFSCRNYLKSANDIVDGDLTGEVSCSQFDSDAVHQAITYSVVDSSGNKATAILSVDIEAAVKPTVPSQSSTGIAPSPSVPSSSQTPSRVNVTAQARDYLVKDGETFDAIYAQCRADGQAALTNHQANGYSCNPIPDPSVPSLHIGYSLTFE